MDKRLLGTKELSAYLGLRVSTIYMWVYQKKIPYIKLGKLIKFDLLEIEQWLGKKRINVNKFIDE